MSEKKKVYFAGSIRGGREDAELYKELINYIKTKAIVLTEHIGNEELLNKEKNLSDKVIYDRDMKWLKESNLIIAECTHPSLGVGYELARAETYNKPCFILYRKSKCNLSAMISGNQYFKIFGYEKKEEAFEIINKLL